MDDNRMTSTDFDYSVYSGENAAENEWMREEREREKKAEAMLGREEYEKRSSGMSADELLAQYESRECEHTPNTEEELSREELEEMLSGTSRFEMFMQSRQEQEHKLRKKYYGGYGASAFLTALCMRFMTIPLLEKLFDRSFRSRHVGMIIMLLIFIGGGLFIFFLNHTSKLSMKIKAKMFSGKQSRVKAEIPFCFDILFEAGCMLLAFAVMEIGW